MDNNNGIRKTIFITGASTGIGFATAKYFSEKGWNVAATMRTLSKGKDLEALPNVRLYELDVTNMQSINDAIGKCLQEFGNIDVLYNNAGYGLVGAFEAMSQQQIDRQFSTNLMGVLNVTRALLPYFREKGKGLIISTSSMGGQITFPLYSVYHSTKWALEGFMESLHFELKQFNIKIKLIEPGAIKTEFENAIDFVSLPAYDNYAPMVHQNMLDTYKTAPGPAVVAAKVYSAATDTSNKLRYPVGNQAPLLLFLRRIIPNSLFFSIVRQATEKRKK